MLPEESQIMHVLCDGLLAGIAEVVPCVLLYGIFVLFFTLSTTTFLHRGLSSRQTWAMFITTIMGFVIATITAIDLVAGFVTFIQAALVDNINLPLDVDRSLTNIRLAKSHILADWCINIVPILTDAVVVWRAWVLFRGQRWMLIAPLFMLFGTVATTFTVLGSISSAGARAIEAETAVVFVKISWASLVLSMATNVTATSLIGYKLWTYRKSAIHNFGPGKRWSVGQNVLFLLVESGVLYCIVQLVYTVIGFSKADVNTVPLQIFNGSSFMISAMYPTVVIVFVNKHRSMVDMYSFNLEFENGEGYVKRN